MLGVYQAARGTVDGDAFSGEQSVAAWTEGGQLLWRIAQPQPQPQQQLQQGQLRSPAVIGAALGGGGLMLLLGAPGADAEWNLVLPPDNLVLPPDQAAETTLSPPLLRVAPLPANDGKPPGWRQLRSDAVVGGAAGRPLAWHAEGCWVGVGFAGGAVCLLPPSAEAGGASCGGGGGAAAAAAACLGGEADEPWAALLSMGRVTVLLSQLLAITEGGAAAEAEPPQQAELQAELLSQVEAYSHALVAQCAALREALGAAGGFAPAPLRTATHLLSLQLPCLCVLQQRWAQQLPAQPKRKKKGEDKAEDKAEEEAPPQPAEPTDLRGALRAASARVAAALSELQEGVGAPEPMACAVLREAPLREHLGGSGAAQQAHQHVLDVLLAAGKTSVATLGTALKHAIAALRQTSKQL